MLSSTPSLWSAMWHVAAVLTRQACSPNGPCPPPTGVECVVLNPPYEQGLVLVLYTVTFIGRVVLGALAQTCGVEGIPCAGIAAFALCCKTVGAATWHSLCCAGMCWCSKLPVPLYAACFETPTQFLRQTCTSTLWTCSCVQTCYGAVKAEHCRQ